MDEWKGVSFLVEPVFDEDGVQASSGIGTDGKEYPDPMPMAVPIGYNQAPDIMSMIRSMVRSEEVRRAAEREGYESFDEADDFEVEDDPVDPVTPYERVFFPDDEKKLNGSAPGLTGVEEAPPPPAPTPAAVGVVDVEKKG